MKTLICALMLLLSFELFAKTAIIVHPNNDSNFNKIEVSRIFIGKAKFFSNGQKAVPLYLTDKPVKDKFNGQFLGRSTIQIKTYWSKLLFTGRGVPPNEVTNEEMLEKVASSEEFIGYIDASLVNDQVKVIYTF
ncbi:phosphate ABC transporter substrate-binding protein [Catenovulum sp. SM1970]|uniref:phosphate ABC transporter substrate-binding protein n=1 Tax=Marinifaba aquimaris TaxID=2741323 RepID=UPI001571DF6E|nr:phosphate ABC transporter substrate-binding protein [Marinifaba aquimaris]NTS77142.1 phosphate ABC transporter substrate-binding protein [Marinifaba aquimaris]